MFRYLQPGGSAEQVGGIVGQSGPDVLISNISVLSEIRAASDRLSNLADQAVSHADSARDDVQDLLNRTEDLLDTNIEAVNDLSVTLTGALDRISPALNDLSDAAAKLTEGLEPVMDCLAEASGDGRQLANDLGRAMESLQTSVRQARTGPITFIPADDACRAAGDRLFGDLTGVSNALKDLNASVTSASDTLLADLRAINRQFSILIDLVLDAIIDLQDGVEDGQRVQDTSEENAAAQTQGKVDRCTNSGLVEGDRNVGGILGSIAIEYALNPEDDGLLNLSFGTTYETKSVVLPCVNRGGVTGNRTAWAAWMASVTPGTHRVLN